MERNFFYAHSLFVSCNAAFKPVYFLPGASSSYAVQGETKDLMMPLQGREDNTSDLDLTLSLKPPGTITEKCYLCGSTESPVWRSNCCGNRMLCNSCGLEVKNKARKMSATMKEPVPMKRKYTKRCPSIRGRKK